MILFGMIISFTTIWEAKKFGGSIFNFQFSIFNLCLCVSFHLKLRYLSSKYMG